MATLREEIERRRTFAIISHPDAGKTTLTEKFLLYGGAINLAGSVKGKKTALCRKRGFLSTAIQPAQPQQQRCSNCVEKTQKTISFLKIGKTQRRNSKFHRIFHSIKGSCMI